MENMEHGEWPDKADKASVTWEEMGRLCENQKDTGWSRAERSLIWTVAVFVFVGKFKLHVLLASKEGKYVLSNC